MIDFKKLAEEEPAFKEFSESLGKKMIFDIPGMRHILYFAYTQYQLGNSVDDAIKYLNLAAKIMEADR